LIAWWLGVALLSGLTLTVLISILQGEHVTLDHITPGIFIPPVGPGGDPGGRGTASSPAQPEALRDLALTINGIGLGAGIFMYLALLALAFHRFYVHKRLPPTMAPTFWINLAPLGVIVISMLNLVAAAPFAGDKSALSGDRNLSDLGFRCLLAGAVRRCLPGRSERLHRLPFSLTWWAFTFPLGAFTLGSQRVSEATGLDHAAGLRLAGLGRCLQRIWTPDPGEDHRRRRQRQTLPASSLSPLVPTPVAGRDRAAVRLT
jgi:tellurite resistance protein TehA-like permease